MAGKRSGDHNGAAEPTVFVRAAKPRLFAKIRPCRIVVVNGLRPVEISVGVFPTDELFRQRIAQVTQKTEIVLNALLAVKQVIVVAVVQFFQNAFILSVLFWLCGIKWCKFADPMGLLYHTRSGMSAYPADFFAAETLDGQQNTIWSEK